jgi:transposase
LISFAGGAAQAEYVSRVRGLAPERCLVVAVDVGKRSAATLVADHHGQVVEDLWEFDLTISGLDRFIGMVADVERRIDAQSVRIGIEAAGHYHRATATTLAHKGFDVVELNPYQVKTARTQMGQARVKTDRRDCLAMVELLVRGQGWPLHGQDGPVAEQAVWVAHRRRKLDAAQALGSQIHALADVAFPGLTGCFSTGLESKTLRMLLATVCEPARVAAMTPTDLVHHAADQGVRMLRPKATQVIAAARDALCVPDVQRQTAAGLLSTEVASLEAIAGQLAACDQRLAELVGQTPAGILLSVPGIGVVTASYYGAALGDPWRFRNADAAYRYSGLAPSSYESAGRRATAVHISKIGSVELRQAMLALGTGLALHHPDFTADKHRLRAAGKKPIVAAIAVAHRAHRLAFALMRSQQPYDPTRWAASVVEPHQAGRSVMATTEAASTT